MTSIATDWAAKKADIEGQLAAQRGELQAKKTARDDLAFSVISGDREARKQVDLLDREIDAGERNQQRLVTALEMVQGKIEDRERSLAQKAEQARLDRLRDVVEAARKEAVAADAALEVLCQHLASLRKLNEAVFREIGDSSASHPLSEFQTAVPVVLQEKLARTGWMRRAVLGLMDDRLSLSGWYPPAQPLVSRAAQIGPQQPISIAAE